MQAPYEIIPIGVILDQARGFAPECELFKMVEGKLFDLICLRTAEMPENHALHMSLLSDPRGEGEANCGGGISALV
jgi:hypothetical protein